MLLARERQRKRKRERERKLVYYPTCILSSLQISAMATCVPYTRSFTTYLTLRRWPRKVVEVVEVVMEREGAGLHHVLPAPSLLV